MDILFTFFSFIYELFKIINKEPQGECQEKASCKSGENNYLFTIYRDIKGEQKIP